MELLDLPGTGLTYAYLVDGDGGWETLHRWDPKRPVLDPYAPLVWGRSRFGVREPKEQFSSPVSGDVAGQLRAEIRYQFSC